MVRGLPSFDHVEQFCDVCVLTKQRRLPFLQQSSFRAKERLELVHGDLCGLVTPATPGGRRYFLLLIDDLSRYMCVVVLGSNGEAANVIRRAQAAAEVECGRKLRTDNGGEFTTAEFITYCADEGVQCHYSAPYSSGPPQAEVNACCLLGRGSGDGCLHPQPLAHQGSMARSRMRLGMGASRRSLTYGSLAASRSARSLATSVSSTTGAL
jgi:hypothetical protein